MSASTHSRHQALATLPLCKRQPKQANALELLGGWVAPLGVADARTAGVEVLKFSGDAVQIKSIASARMYYQRGRGSEGNFVLGKCCRDWSKTFFSNHALKSWIAVVVTAKLPADRVL
jgi:hypothetical protein